MENNKYNNYYSRKTISELIAELRIWKNDTTKADWYQALILHLLERELSEVERKQADNIINSDKKTLTQRLENLVELYNSRIINREEFEALKQELFTDKKIASPPIAKPEVKSNSEIEIKDKAQPNVHSTKYNNSTNSAQKKELKALVAVAAFLIICFTLPYLLKSTSVSTNSYNNNNNNNNNTQISTPPSSTNVSPSTTDGNTCSVCGKKFYGLGYEEVSDGVWRQSTSNQYFICSEDCGLKATRKMNNLTQQAVQEHGVSNGSICTNCGLGRYVNGFCSKCGAASREVVEEHNSRMPVCGLCKGTGIEMPMGANTGGETGRICPACNGTGHSSY